MLLAYLVGESNQLESAFGNLPEERHTEAEIRRVSRQ